MERRLAAILAADVVNFSGMTEADDEGTLALLNSLRTSVIEPHVSKHNGRVFKVLGDGFLVEFPSVVEAVDAAMDIQKSVCDYPTAADLKMPLALRIGVDIGDVIIESDDLYGDGVNVATRLESLAQAGEVVVSQEVYDKVKRKLPYGFQAMGRKRLKNIERPVRTYRIRTKQNATNSKESMRQKIRTGFGFGLALSTMCVFGVAVYVLMDISEFDLAFSAENAVPLPDKPSIVVLPFRYENSGDQDELFAKGLTEDVTTDLSSVAGLFVISRYTAQNIDAAGIGLHSISRGNRSSICAARQCQKIV